jgi:hypothetical protein
MGRPAKTKPAGAKPRVGPGLEEFVTAVRSTNPFAVNRVTEPSSYDVHVDVDVASIHAEGFDRLVALAGQAMRQKSGVGVALLGGAGVGKSHLLSRLYRWANETVEGGLPRACYVYLHNILSDPERLPRYLLKYVVSRLAEGGRGPLYQTPLYRFVDRTILHAIEAAEARPANTKEVHDAFLACFPAPVGTDNPYEVLYQFRRHARPEKAADPVRRHVATQAIAWLSGDEIDPDAARWLGLKVDPQQPAMVPDDQEVEQVLLTLTRLAFVNHQPFILCVDQFENLDPDKLKPLVRFLHALLDHASNMLLITSGVKQTLLKYRSDGIIPEASWDRIAEHKVDLKRVSKPDARKILEARLERFLDRFLGVDAVRRHLHEDSLFPLGRSWLETQLGDGVEFRPRDVLT